MKRWLSISLSLLSASIVLALLYMVTQPQVKAAPLALTPIATARAAGAGWTGGVEGNVIVPPSVYRSDSFAIQDNTGGVYIFVASSTGVSIPSLSLGDVVQVTGTLKLFNGSLLEFDPVSAIVKVGPGTPPAPQDLATSPSIVSPTQGSLIRVSGIASWPGTPPAPGASDWVSMTINDGSGALVVFIDKDTRIDMRGYTSPVSMTITGFSSSNYDTPQITPRYQSDIYVPDTTPPNVVSTTPANNASNVSLYKPLSAVFSEAITPTTITDTTFTEHC